VRGLLEASFEEVGGLEKDGSKGAGAETGYKVECCAPLSTYEKMKRCCCCTLTFLRASGSTSRAGASIGHFRLFG
jgi:hypothetical protein